MQEKGSQVELDRFPELMELKVWREKKAIEFTEPSMEEGKDI